MFSSEEQSRLRRLIQQAESVASAADNGAVAEIHYLTVTVCDVDLPCCISNGELYVQAPFQIVLDAMCAALGEFLSDMETRVSEARRTALASTDLFPTVHFKRMAGQDVVPDSGEQR